ncbi:MAG: nuclear transport factor 2 family protein [Ginsengibacter sp.]
MKKRITAILIILLAFANNFCSAQQPDEAVIRGLENSEREAILKGDTAMLFKLWSPDIVVNNPVNIVVTLEQIKERLRTGHIDYSSFERIIEKIAFEKNVAIVMGKETLTPQKATENAGKTVTRRFTNIWMKENGNWRLSVRQATVISVQ